MDVPTSSPRIRLYDLSCAGEQKCWSPSTWKTRFVLNFKNLDYETEWVQHPDISSVLQAQNIPPNASSSSPSNPVYTLPSILLPSISPTSTSTTSSSVQKITDSAHIAVALETLSPTPTLHLTSPSLARVEALLAQTMGLFAPIGLPLIVSRGVVSPRAAEYYEANSVANFGLSLAQLESEKGGEAAWEALRVGPLRELAGLLGGENRDGGPFVLGAEVSYADFLIAALLQSSMRIGGGLYERIVDVDEAFARLYEATQKWAVRDNY